MWRQLNETTEPRPFTEQERTDYLKSIAARPTDEFTELIWASLLAEVKKGVADLPVTANWLDRVYGRGNWVPTNCFCHEQASGKRRRIDNARKSGCNRATRQTEKLAMNTAMAPTLAAKLSVRKASMCPHDSAAYNLVAKGLRIGGEDMPNAFRSIPIMPTHLCHNIVAAKDPATGELRYWQMYAAFLDSRARCTDSAARPPSWRQPGAEQGAYYGACT